MFYELCNKNMWLINLIGGILLEEATKSQGQNDSTLMAISISFAGFQKTTLYTELVHIFSKKISLFQP